MKLHFSHIAGQFSQCAPEEAAQLTRVANACDETYAMHSEIGGWGDYSEVTQKAEEQWSDVAILRLAQAVGLATPQEIARAIVRDMEGE